MLSTPIMLDNMFSEGFKFTVQLSTDGVCLCGRPRALRRRHPLPELQQHHQLQGRFLQVFGRRLRSVPADLRRHTPLFRQFRRGAGLLRKQGVSPRLVPVLQQEVHPHEQEVQRRGRLRG